MAKSNDYTNCTPATDEVKQHEMLMAKQEAKLTTQQEDR